MLSRNVDLPEDEIAAFKEIKDKWYEDIRKDVISRPKKFKAWNVLDGMLYKYANYDLLDPLYSRDESWRLVVSVSTEKKFWGMRIMRHHQDTLV